MVPHCFMLLVHTSMSSRTQCHYPPQRPESLDSGLNQDPGLGRFAYPRTHCGSGRSAPPFKETRHRRTCWQSHRIIWIQHNDAVNSLDQFRKRVGITARGRSTIANQQIVAMRFQNLRDFTDQCRVQTGVEQGPQNANIFGGTAF